jgi:cytochrome c-type biogenesis protein
MEGLASLVDGPLYLAIPVAMLAGLVSFLSPCVLPLVPGYLGYVGGQSGSGSIEDRRRLLLGVALFILGFAIVFTVTVTVAGALGAWLIVYRDLITRVSGVIVIALGLVFIGRFGVLQRQVKLGWAPATGPAGALLLGIVFGIGWTPCIGPTLGSIQLLAISSGSAAQGVVLGVFYSLGLGIPFLLAAIGFGWFATGTRWVKKHIRVINIVGGAILIVVGVLMVSGLWIVAMNWLQGVVLDFTPAL